MPTSERSVSAAVLRCAGRAILLDCGEGTQVALRREKVSPIKIDLIALTHYHGDHIFGLPGLLKTMNCLKREDPLVITGPDGLEAALEPILKMAGPLDYEVRLEPMSDPVGICMQTFHAKWPAGALLRKIPTEHRVPSQGYSFTLSRPAKFLPDKASALGIPVSMWKQIIQDDPLNPVRINGEDLKQNGQAVCGYHVLGEARKGLHVVFSGDTQPCHAIKSYAYHADLLIHDATYGEDEQGEEAALWGHSTFRQAAETAAEAQVVELWLTHFSQSMKDPADYLPNAQAIFPNTVCGVDGLAITLRFENSD